MRKVVLIIILILVGGVAEAEESNEPLVGYLDIINKLEGNPGNINVRIKRDTEEWLPGANDGIDIHDTLWLTPPPDRPSIQLIIGGSPFEEDASNEQSKKTYPTWLVYNGAIPQDTNNWLEFSFTQIPEEPLFVFKDGTGTGYQPILYHSDRLPYGSIVDVRRAINQNSGIVPLIDLPAGSYSTGTPYGEGIITIGTRLLSDLNDSNDVDLGDFALISMDWKQSGSGLVSDICGVNGIPDGTVDMYDLICFIEEWLQ